MTTIDSSPSGNDSFLNAEKNREFFRRAIKMFRRFTAEVYYPIKEKWSNKSSQKISDNRSIVDLLTGANSDPDFKIFLDATEYNDKLEKDIVLGKYLGHDVGNLANEIGGIIGTIGLIENDEDFIFLINFFVNNWLRFAHGLEDAVLHGLNSAEIDSEFKHVINLDEIYQTIISLKDSNAVVGAVKEKLVLEAENPSDLLKKDEIILGNTAVFSNALSNIIRNATSFGSKKVVLFISRSEDTLTVQVVDDGGGIRSYGLDPKSSEFIFKEGVSARFGDEDSHSGLGLANMPSRMNSLGAELQVQSNGMRYSSVGEFKSVEYLGRPNDKDFTPNTIFELRLPITNLAEL